MEPRLPAPSSRKRRPYKKSRFGCRNCKLRRIKCDETKPECQRCKDYGVLCNFSGPVLDLQPAPNRLQGRSVGPDGGAPASMSLPLVCSDSVASFEMDARNMARLERFRMRTLHCFSAEMMRIWKHLIPCLAFRSPYLMHTMLAVSAAHERFQDMPTGSPKTRSELHHTLQSALLFKHKLSHPVNSTDRDALWATAALLGIMAIASFDVTTPDKAWPLRPSCPTDLEWFRLSDNKKVIWNLTDPLRPGGIFRAMAHEYAQFEIEIPSVGVDEIPRALAEVCQLNMSSNKANNPYFVAAHVLVRLQRPSNNHSAGVRMVSFMCQSQEPFRALLSQKDPVALLLLAMWYAQAGPAMWWIEPRARVESQAIRLYLEQFHGEKRSIHELLPSLPY